MHPDHYATMKAASGRTAAAPDALVPVMAPIARTVLLYGVSRSKLYREAAAGTIRMVKAGRTTLVDLASVRAFLATLPEATIRQPTRAA